ncbi:MAG TPA: ADOP family duplicated permease [Gemmatimonadaceae bacterium]|nr:ADOP family duplicated permease [Gemmatimonadaceae bacterium]
MARIPGLRRLVRVERDRAGVDRAVDDELQFHFDMTMRELMANGLNPDDARRETERRFGDVQRTREKLATIDRSRVGRERRAEWWSAFAQDLRYAARGLRRKPGFATAVVLTLGLGIGANATMFGIVDRLLFRPPAFLDAPEHAGRLYFASMRRGKESISSGSGYRAYLDLEESTTSFDAMTPFYADNLAVGEGEATKEMHVAVSAADLWRMFDVKPVIGRFFTGAEDKPPAGARVAVLSYAYWKTQFGGRRDVLGSLVSLGSAKYTVIGVAPEGFVGFSSDPVVAFVPITAEASAEGIGNARFPWYENYGLIWFDVFARRKPNVAPAAADADLNRAYQLSYKKMLLVNPKRRRFDIARPRAFAGPVLADRGPEENASAKVATWLIGVAGMVLLIACANVMNLLLARALRRRREVAVRIALGVSRGRLLMQLLIESVLLAALGGVAGLALAQWGGGVMRSALLDSDAGGVSAFGDRRTLVAVGLLVLVAGLLTGLAPIVQSMREDVTAALKAGAREGKVHRSRLRSGLLVFQAALSVVLLVGAGLFIRSLVKVENLRMGYDANRLVWIELNSRAAKSDSVHDVMLRQQLLARAEQLPVAEHAARALTVPFWSTWIVQLYVDGIDSVGALGSFTLQAASPGFLRTMGTRLVRGREFTSADDEQAPRVMIVGESMAKRLWPQQDALGKCVRVLADTMPCTTVVGVAEDVRRSSLSEMETHYYLPIAQFRPQQGGLFIRTRDDAASHADEIRRALQPLMPGTSYLTVTPMSTIIAPQIRSWKLGAIMFAAFGLLALALAAIGLYGVIAYNVTQRTHEMGVRVALGAQARDVIRLIVREGLGVAVPGVMLGAIIALVAGKWLGPLLFEVSPRDPQVITAVVATLIIVAVAASWIPATRASRVDPNEALRSE